MLPELWSAFHNDDEIRYQSSSGGVFSALASVVLDSGGVVYGSAMIEDASGLHCKHISCEHREGLHQLRGSKYTVSDVREAFPSVKQELERGRSVLFCGAPCQVAALYAFLGKCPDHLITVDFICHGIPAPVLLKKCIEEKELHYKKKIRQVAFRDKTEGWLNYSFKVVFEDGSSDRKTANRSEYMRMFLSDMYLRPSCYRCRFKGNDHCSDLTLGDFWGAQEYLEISEETLQKGLSAVVLQTEKGQRLFHTASADLTTQKCDMHYFTRSNRSYFDSAFPSCDILFFRHILKRWDMERILSFYDRTNKIRRLINRIVRKVKKLLRRSLHRAAHEISLPSKKECCGCMNCRDMCPVNAVSMIRDDLGFEFPVITQNMCISCGRCVDVCPCCKNK